MTVFPRTQASLSANELVHVPTDFSPTRFERWPVMAHELDPLRDIGNNSGFAARYLGMRPLRTVKT